MGVTGVIMCYFNFIITNNKLRSGNIQHSKCSKSILSKLTNYVVLTFTHPSSKMKTTDSSHRVSLLTDRKSRQPDVQRFLRVQWRRQSANLLDEGRQVHRGFGRGAGSGD